MWILTFVSMNIHACKQNLSNWYRCNPPPKCVQSKNRLKSCRGVAPVFWYFQRWKRFLFERWREGESKGDFIQHLQRILNTTYSCQLKNMLLISKRKKSDITTKQQFRVFILNHFACLLSHIKCSHTKAPWYSNHIWQIKQMVLYNFTQDTQQLLKRAMGGNQSWN